MTGRSRALGSGPRGCVPWSAQRRGSAQRPLPGSARAPGGPAPGSGARPGLDALIDTEFDASGSFVDLSNEFPAPPAVV